MNALITGVAGFIGSTLAGRLIDEGARVTGIDCFTDYYPRELKDANVAALRGRPRFTFLESTIQQAPLADLLSDTTHVFHLAAQAGVRKSWGRDFQSTRRTTSRRRRSCSKPRWARGSRNWSTRRVRRCTATRRRYR